MSCPAPYRMQLPDKDHPFRCSDIGGMYYTVANAYAGLASKESSDLKFEVKNTAGSAANLRLLSGNYIDLGIAQADLVRAAHEGTGSFF